MIHTDSNKKIYTDKKQINTDEEHGSTGLLYADLTYKVRGAAFSVYNELGFGHKENVYQKALSKEFDNLLIPFKREVDLKVKYKGEVVGNYRPDFVVGDKVVLEIKATELMPKVFETQLLNYLKTTGFALGLLVNFGAAKLFIKRLIWTANPRQLVNDL